MFAINKNNDKLNFVCKYNGTNDKIDCGLLVKEATDLCDGKGGGSKKQAQGGGQTLEDLSIITNMIESKVNEL